MLQATYSRRRQARVLERMAELKLDAVVVGASHHVYFLTAHLTGWLQQSAAVLFADGRCWLTTANRPAQGAAADQTDAYEAQWNSTLRQEQAGEVARQVVGVLGAGRARRVGVDASAVTAGVAGCRDFDVVSFEPELWQIRRVKDADELALMRRAIGCTQAMYRKAREIIEPGVSELEVFGKLHAAAVESAGEPLSALLGNDFACRARGGPARAGHFAEAGDLYILDLGPAYRGYFSDNCRTMVVGGRASDAQLRAHANVVAALAIVEQMARPGVRCREIYAAVDEHFKRARGAGMDHHLGHGVGLQPHEYPHLNPRWDDTLIEGEVFTAEPGEYGDELRAGIRIENNYLVTASGVQSLLKFSTDL